jgi:hypothetical protein
LIYRALKTGERQAPPLDLHWHLRRPSPPTTGPDGPVIGRRMPMEQHAYG